MVGMSLLVKKNPVVRSILRISAGAVIPAFFLSAFALATIPPRASADDNQGVLCTFESQMDFPDLCPAAGQSSLRMDYWQMGLLPRRPLPALPLDPALAELDRMYGRVGESTELNFYASVDDAIAGKAHHHIYKGFVYVSIVDKYVRPEGTFYRTGDGWIVRRDDVAPITNKEQFSGITLAQAPRHPFGWVLPYEGAYPSRTPGGPADNQATYYPRYTLVEVFDSQTVDTTAWFMVGINQWIEQTKLGLIYPTAARPEGVPAGVKWISINLFEQSLAAYEGDKLVFATLVASGLPLHWTRPGTFQIVKKLAIQTMSGGSNKGDNPDYYYVGDVPWVMYFDRLRAIHGEYWHNNLGGRHSHGCVNVPVADGHWLYNWAPEGTWVYVFDPSGKTPTEDKYYLNDAGI
jgi:hypothetical protein